MQFRNTLFYFTTLCFFSIYSVNSNALQGDVHARDLNISGLGWAGHTGIEAKNGYVLEMLNMEATSNWGNSLSIQYNHS